MVSLPAHLKYNVNTSRSLTLDVDGNGVIYIGPQKVRERWIVTGMSTFIDTTDETFSPKLHIHKNGHELVAGSYNANDDTSSGDTIELRNGETLKFVVTNAEPGTRWEIGISGRGYAI
jgi:hypothetical protein